MARKRVGAIDSTTVMLIGAGALALYLFTRPKTTLPGQTMLPGYYPTPAQQAAAAAAQASTTNTAITQGASVVTNLINQLFG